MQGATHAQHPAVTWRLNKVELSSTIREFSHRLNEDRALLVKLRRPRGVKLSADETVSLMQAKKHLPAQHVVVDGRRYARTYDGGNPASEALVRSNLGQFVSEVRSVVKEALQREETGLIVAMCRSYEDGIQVAGFFTMHGTPLGKNRAFGEAIKQFFKDESLVLKIVLVALREHKGQMSSHIPIVGSVTS